MNQQRTRVGTTVMAAAAFALLWVAFAARPAQAQIPDCGPSTLVPPGVVNGIEANYPTLDERSCLKATKAALKGCKKGSSIAAKCRYVLNDAVILAEVLACLAIADSALQEVCIKENKADLKSRDEAVKEQKTTADDACTDTVPTAVFDNC